MHNRESSIRAPPPGGVTGRSISVNNGITTNRSNMSNPRPRFPFKIVPKPQELRPIIDLREPNKFMKKEHFKMEGIIW
jgi:hypothetical protein